MEDKEIKVPPKEKITFYSATSNPEEGKFEILSNEITEQHFVQLNECLYQFVVEWRNGKKYEYYFGDLAMNDDMLEVYRKNGKKEVSIPKEKCTQAFKEACAFLEKKFLEQKNAPKESPAESTNNPLADNLYHLAPNE